MAKRVPQCTNTKEVGGEAVLPDSKVKIWVGYDENGDIAAVQPGEAAECFEVLEGDLTVERLKSLADSKGRKNLDVKTTKALRLSSSPNCWMYIGGIKVWVC